MVRNLFPQRIIGRVTRGKRRRLLRREPAWQIVLTSAVHGALIAGARKYVAGVGLRCVAKYAAKGAFVGALGGAVPFILTWSSLGAELGHLIMTVGQSRLLGGKC